MAALDHTLLDLDQITTGKDGRLYVIKPGTNQSVFLAHVNDWSAQVEIVDTDYQAAYDFGIGKVGTGARTTLTVTEAVISDDTFLRTVIAAMRPPPNGARRPYVPYFDFVGFLDSADDRGTRGKYALTKMKPTGTFDFFTITPGGINERAWNFASRSLPRIDQYLATAT